MKTFRQYLKEGKDLMIEISFDWFYEEEMDVTVDETFGKLFDAGISYVGGIETASGDGSFTITMSGHSSVFIPLLNKVFKKMGEPINNSVNVLYYNLQDLDVGEAIDTARKIKANVEMVIFTTCTITKNFTRLQDEGNPKFDFYKNTWGNPKDSPKVYPIVFKYYKHKIDAFDFQDQMVTAGFEKYL